MFILFIHLLTHKIKVWNDDRNRSKLDCAEHSAGTETLVSELTEIAVAHTVKGSQKAIVYHFLDQSNLAYSSVWAL